MEPDRGRQSQLEGGREVEGDTDSSRSQCDNIFIRKDLHVAKLMGHCKSST